MSSDFLNCSGEALNAVPMNRIDCESLDSVDLKPGEKQQDTGFIRELLDLLFPSSGGNKMKRVEYRPRAFKPALRENSEPAIVNRSDPTSVNSNENDEEFLLKLLEIYLNSYHCQLSDFLPKCINFHLIQRVIKGLPTVLLQQSSLMKTGKGGIEKIRRERGKIERILKVIEEIKLL